jgi:RNA polymerase sigma factor (sigma-70 family)
MVPYYSDKAILEGLREQKKGCIEYLYREFFPVVRSIVVRNSGNQQDVEDVFQDALVILYKRCKNNDFMLNSSLKTYFYAVGKNIWLQRLERKYQLRYQADFEVNESEIRYESEDFGLREDNLERMRLYREHFYALGPDCQKLLKLFFSKKSMRDIAMILGYKDEKYAKFRKYLCKNMLANRIKDDPRCREYFDYG